MTQSPSLQIPQHPGRELPAHPSQSLAESRGRTEFSSFLRGRQPLPRSKQQSLGAAEESRVHTHFLWDLA